MTPPRPVLRLLLARGLACVLGLALFAPGEAQAHAPPTIYVVAKVSDEEVRLDLILTAPLFEAWLPSLHASEVEGLDGEKLEQAQASIEAFFEQSGRVTIDRVPVRAVARPPMFEAFTDHEVDWEYVRLVLVFGSKGKPRQVGFVWQQYDAGLAAIFESIEAEVEGYGETSYYVFRDQEPEFIWHAPRERAPVAETPLPTAPARKEVTLPLLSVGLALVLLTGLLLRRPRPGGHARTAWVTSLLALTLGLSEVAPATFALPGDDSPAPLAQDEALYVFSALHRNIYRAFDYDDEDEIYETLSRSVTGSMLDAVYQEVYASLVMQEAGGAISKITSTEILEAGAILPEDGSAGTFQVRTRWRVTGKVGHWGHSHVRVNEYEALYTMALEGREWKIAAVQVLSQERVDDGSRRGNR